MTHVVVGAWNKKLVLGVALALGLVGGVGVQLEASQQGARERLEDDVAQRATLASQLTTGALQNLRDDNVAFATDEYSGKARAVQRSIDADEDSVPGSRSVVQAADGSVLGAYPRAQRRRATELGGAAEILAARRTGLMSYSDIQGGGDSATLMAAVPFGPPSRPRVWAFSVPALQVSAFVGAYLTSALAVEKGGAYLLDSKGEVIASTGREGIGSRLPDADVASAAAEDGAGRLGDRYFASTAVRGTTWRLIFIVPTSALYAPVEASNREAWALYAGLLLVLLGLLWTGGTALHRSQRLAYERLHDALTGLPNRVLLADHTAALLARLKDGGGNAAMLFVDLDRFKPVNDRHGHAVGDALLTAVAERLCDGVRPGDLVSRFGGDEFVVLAADIPSGDDAYALAARIQKAIATPFEIDGIVLEIDCSIGIAKLSMPPEQTDAATLIQHADIAMYRAKQRGHDRIEFFDAVPPTPARARAAAAAAA